MTCYKKLLMSRTACGTPNPDQTTGKRREVDCAQCLIVLSGKA